MDVAQIITKACYMESHGIKKGCQTHARNLWKLLGGGLRQGREVLLLPPLP